MGERFQRFLNVLKKVKDGIKAEKKMSEAIKNLPPPSLFPLPPILTKTHAHIVKQYQEYEEGIMREIMISKATYPEAVKRMRKLIGCPDDMDPAEYLGRSGRRYGTPAWMSPEIPHNLPDIILEGQEDQDTTEKKKPTQSLSGPLESIRESLKKGQD